LCHSFLAVDVPFTACRPAGRLPPPRELTLPGPGHQLCRLRRAQLGHCARIAHRQVRYDPRPSAPLEPGGEADTTARPSCGCRSRRPTRDAGKPEAFRGLILETCSGAGVSSLQRQGRQRRLRAGFHDEPGTEDSRIRRRGQPDARTDASLLHAGARGWPRPSGRVWVKRFVGRRRLHPGPLTSAEYEMGVLTSAHAWRRRPCSPSGRLDGVSR
jgi:hypothetical protein